MLSKIRKYGLIRTIKLIWSALLSRFYFKRFYDSYSQYSEDVIIDKLIGGKDRGFYIDIGAFDPIKLNNTNRFYQKGWEGINLDPNPKTIEKFKHTRPRDINLNFAVSNKEGEIRCVRFMGMNSYEVIDSGVEIDKSGVEDIIKVRSQPLKKIFEQYIPKEVDKVDFISIDVEGHELEVLKSNDWFRFRPKIICIEGWNEDNLDQGKKINKFLKKVNYKKIKSTGLNDIYTIQKRNQIF